MADFYKGIPIIDDGTDEGFFRPAGVGFGCVPRDYDVDPVAMAASPAELRLIPASEYDARFDESEANESSLEHLYLSGPGGTPVFENLDQGRDGDCWAYSTGHAAMLERLRQNLPYVRLNPHSIAALTGRPDTGGWCGLSHKFMKGNGCAVEGTGPGQWPKQSHDLKYNTPACQAEMAKYKIAEDYYDLGLKEWNQKLSDAQLATCAFMNIPCPVDFNWWGHSVCQVRVVRIEPGSWGRLILNSWYKWGRYGLGVLRGSKANANNAVALRRMAA